MVEFRDVLHDCMQRKGYTVDAVAELIGVSTYTVEKWLRGVQQPLPKYVFKLSKLTGLTTVDLAYINNKAHSHTSQLSYIVHLCAYSYGLSVAEFARKVGISAATVSRWKYDYCVPAASVSDRLAKAFTWEPGWVAEYALRSNTKTLNKRVVQRAVGSLSVFCRAA